MLQIPMLPRAAKKKAVGWNSDLVIRPDTPLTGAQKKQLAKAVKRAKRDGKIAATAQQTIPYEEMYQNGVCSLGSHLYSKSVIFEDRSYTEVSDEEKGVILELYCRLVNYFGPSVAMELSVVCFYPDLEEYRRILCLRDEGDDFDPIRRELSDLLMDKASQCKTERRLCMTFTVEADCDFTYVLSASAKPTALNFNLSGRDAESTIANKRDGKTYAVRYYLDTEPDRSGEHYLLDMIESEPFNYTVSAEGSLAPTGEYHVTAVLVDRITGDFNGDGEIGEDEYSWVTVDTATSTATISYTNVNTPSEPTNVTLAATGNETLTASWTAVDDADGYRVTLHYEKGGEWKQAGAPYELENADFAANSSQPAATINGSTYSLRMAPTVHGKELEISGTENPSVTGTGSAYDDAPANVNYYAAVESFKRDADASGEDGALDTRYYSNAVASRPTNLPAYEPKEITVTASNGQQVTLNSDNGYDTLTWNEIPTGALFTINDYSGFTVEIAPEPGTGTFTVGTNGDVTADDDGKALIEGSGRVKLTVTEGKDTTEYYLRLTLDDIAPVVTLDNENVAADPNTGKYAITGTTEPGLSVKLTIPRATEQNDEADDEVVTATADDTGRFTIPGVLTRNSGTDPSETAGFESLLGKVTAQDSMGNLSDPAAVIVTPREQWTPPENPSSPSGGSGLPMT